MARYKFVDSSPRLLPVDLLAQLIPGTFEHALDRLIDHELDLEDFDAAYRNDAAGAAAYAPSVLLKALLFGYSRGLVSSRSIERACRENRVFIALTRDAVPHFTTLAGFVRAHTGLRTRDERFAAQARHRERPDPLYHKTPLTKQPALFVPADFRHDAETQTCICPTGKRLHGNGANIVTRGCAGVKFRGAIRDCGPCEFRARCLRKPDITPVRQVVFFHGKAVTTAESATDRMKHKIDSPAGREHYAQRLAVVEPVFANLRYNKKLDRFTLRGRPKVDAQWKLYCLVHNIEKLARYGSMF